MQQETTSQNKTILAHLQNGKSITPIQALSLYGCLRLAARISNLKADGHDIIPEMVYEGKKRFARYTLKV